MSRLQFRGYFASYYHISHLDLFPTVCSVCVRVCCDNGGLRKGGFGKERRAQERPEIQGRNKEPKSILRYEMGDCAVGDLEEREGAEGKQTPSGADDTKTPDWDSEIWGPKTHTHTKNGKSRVHLL